MKVIHSHYKWQSGGRYYLRKQDSTYLVHFSEYGTFGEMGDYAVSRFSSLKQARKALLENVWDHPNFQGLKFPKTARLVRKYLGA